MAKTNKQRQQDFVERHRNDPEFKAKQAARKRQWRKTRKLSKTDIRRERQAAADRQRKCRERKKVLPGTPIAAATPLKAYGSSASLGKAVKRASRNLPLSPRKRIAVVKKLAISVNLFGDAKCHVTKRKLAVVPDDVVERVKDFYVRDDVSRQAPGIKDCIVIRDTGDKRKEQKRHMLMTVFEAYKCYCAQYPEDRNKVGKSKFAEFRPKHVLLQAQTPQNVCVCIYHENIRLLLLSLHEKAPELPLTTSELIGLCSCSAESSDCMMGDCAECNDLSRFDDNICSKLDQKLTEELKWYAWQTASGNQAKIIREGIVEEAFDELKRQLPAFMKHEFIKKAQSRWFQQLRSDVDGKKCLLQMDFSENYSVTYQDEIQSAHWHQKQVTVFTAVLWVREAECQSYVIVSDSIHHGKEAVCTFLIKLLNEALSKYPSIRHVDVFTDGAASQFKNKFLFCFLSTKLPSVVDIQLSWNFFATSHGKGAVDGVGGTVKRAVASAVNSRSCVVTDASSFAEAAKSRCPNICILLVSAEDIDNFSKSHTLEETWQLATAIPNTQAIHCVEILSNTSDRGITYSMYSSQVQKQIHKFQSLAGSTSKQVCHPSRSDDTETPPCSITPGSTFVAVIYDDQWWPGLVQAIRDETAVISFMVPQKNCRFKWPRKHQIEEVPVGEILTVLNSPPEPVNQRGLFAFTEMETARVTNLMHSLA